MIRRVITLCLCSAAFWGGMKFERFQQVDACLDAGGSWDSGSFCVKGTP
jgi:hypothetical protein